MPWRPLPHPPSALRDWVLAAYDVRACVLEVAARWVGSAHWGALPLYEQQLVALEALQVYAPLAHALGLASVASEMEDAAFRVVFPSSYASTGAWMRSLSDAAHAALHGAAAQLAAALERDDAFRQLAAGCEVRARGRRSTLAAGQADLLPARPPGYCCTRTRLAPQACQLSRCRLPPLPPPQLRVRTKSTLSVFRKLLRLDNLAAGGRSPDQLWDLLGLRAIVVPRPDLAPPVAEAAAEEACYRVRDVAHTLWVPVAGRAKDYIAAPKPNGYRSLHSTLWLCGDGDDERGAAAGVCDVSGAPSVDTTWEEEAGVGLGARDSGGSSASTGSSRAGPSTPASSSSSSGSDGSSGGSGGNLGSSSRLGVGGAPSAAAAGAGSCVLCTLELQVRTSAMHAAAEAGDAAHAGYKGGLDTRQVGAVGGGRVRGRWVGVEPCAAQEGCADPAAACV